MSAMDPSASTASAALQSPTNTPSSSSRTIDHLTMPPVNPNPIIPAVFGPVPNREYHEGFMRKAIQMAEFALASDETPVGCVFVHKGEIIGRGINGTNASLNGTRHAEFVALAEIMSRYPQSIIKDTDLYVTVEPCIMCASALRQYGIRAVYFGCLNDRFGGCGGVMTIHSDKGVDPPYPAYGGLFREEAIMLLRKFYVQENNKAPEPKPKKNRELKTEILPIGIPTNTPLSSTNAIKFQPPPPSTSKPEIPMTTMGNLPPLPTASKPEMPMAGMGSFPPPRPSNPTPAAASNHPGIAVPLRPLPPRAPAANPPKP